MSEERKATDGGKSRGVKLGAIPDYGPYPTYALPGMRDLQRHLERDAMLRHLWYLFLDGSLSFDRMLVAAVVLLADQNDRLTAEATVRVTRSGGDPVRYWSPPPGASIGDIRLPDPAPDHVAGPG